MFHGEFRPLSGPGICVSCGTSVLYALFMITNATIGVYWHCFIHHVSSVHYLLFTLNIKWPAWQTFHWCTSTLKGTICLQRKIIFKLLPHDRLWTCWQLSAVFDHMSLKHLNWEIRIHTKSGGRPTRDRRGHYMLGRSNGRKIVQIIQKQWLVQMSEPNDKLMLIYTSDEQVR